jgi:predicted metal-dependent peptidase
MLVKFFSALDDLSKLATFTVVPFDSEVGVSHIYEWKKGKRHKVERVMHGGTSFIALTDYVNKNNEWDVLFVCTDLCAEKPQPCVIPRIWISDANCSEKPYFSTNERIISVD